MEDLQFEQLIKQGQEDRRLEYKAPGSWDDYWPKIVKCCLAMSNKKDGGFLVIGVSEMDDRCIPEGLSDQMLGSYDVELIQERVNSYANPYIDIQLHKPEIDGMKFVVIRISEFSETPVICKNGHGQGKGALRKATFYVRPLGGRPRSEEVHDVEDMRAIIDLAVDKVVEKTVRRCRAFDEIIDAESKDLEAYAKQLGGL